MTFARLNGVVIHYRDRGGDQPAVVFSNSLGTDFRIWDQVASHLEGDFRIIQYDKRGHGLSEAPEPPYAMMDHVGDLSALLDHLAIGKAVIVGLSVGGMIAQGLASLAPEKVAALVLFDTGHRIGDLKLWDSRIEAVKSGGVVSLAPQILERWFTPEFRSSDNPDFVGYSAMLTRTSSDGYIGTCAAIRDADLTEASRALRLPVHCAVGDQDRATPPALVRELAGLIEGAGFEIIKDSGHLPCIEQPVKTARIIADFLNNLGNRW